MTEEQFLDKLRDLVHNFVNSSKEDRVMYGETIETKRGTVDFEIDVFVYNND